MDVLKIGAVGVVTGLLCVTCGDNRPSPVPPSPQPAPAAPRSGSEPTPATTRPLAPINVRAEVDTEFPGVSLTWEDRSPDESVFILEKSVRSDAGPWEGHIALSNDEVSSLDSFVSEGVRYCYRVRAQNAAGSSIASNSVCIVFDLPRRRAVVESVSHP